MASRKWCSMISNNKAVIHYLLAIMVFTEWLDTGLLSNEEFVRIEALLADKYELPKSSIYRCKPLL